MATDPLLQEQLARRVAETEGRRKKVLDRYAAQDWTQLAPPEQTVNRLEYLQRHDLAQAYSRTAGTRPPGTTFGVEWMAPTGEAPEAAAAAVEELGDAVFEQIIGQSEIMPIRFLHEGSRTARSIGRIVLRTQRKPNGTGFLVSPRLLLTNTHVLRTVEDARSNLVQFDYLSNPDGSMAAPVEFDLQPDVLYLRSPIEELDCVLVAVEPVNGTGVELGSFGWCTLIGREGKEHPGVRVNVIHHPGGIPKQVSLRENFVALVLDDYLHYMTDTAPGSSGSPVFNDEWEVVALHHAGLEITDEAEIAAYRKALGTDVPDGMDPDAAIVTVNEGSRISRIVEWLSREAGGLTGEARALLDEALADALEGLALPVAPHTVAPIHGAGVTININVGGGAAPAVTVDRGTVPAGGAGLELFSGEGQRAVLRGLSHLQERREGAYLPSLAEQEDRKSEYYENLPAEVAAGNLSDAELYDRLNERISEAGGLLIAGSFPEKLEGLESLHRAALESLGLEAQVMLEDAKYDRSRAHLYTWVDLHPDRMLHCVYTGALISPEQLLLKDLITELKMSADLPRRFRNNQFLNCEHVVPQSWFHHEPVPRADLHHLFAADGAANNYRSDSVFRVLEGDPAAVSGPAGLPEYIPEAGLKATGPKRFEPFRSKPIVARATLYFLIAHKGDLDSSKIHQGVVDTLIEWSKLADPGVYEQHRNESIFEVQHNRNPLIDFPAWVDEIDFMRGVTAV